MAILPHILDAAERETVDQVEIAKSVAEDLEEDAGIREREPTSIDEAEHRRAIRESVRHDVHWVLARMSKTITVLQLLDAFRDTRVAEQLATIDDAEERQMCASEIFHDVAEDAFTTALAEAGAFKHLDLDDPEQYQAFLGIVREHAVVLAERHGFTVPVDELAEAIEMRGPGNEENIKWFIDAVEDVQVDMFDVLRTYDAEPELNENEFDEDDEPIRAPDVEHEAAIRETLTAISAATGGKVSLPALIELFEDSDVTRNLPLHEDERDACLHSVFYKIAESALLRAEGAEKIFGTEPTGNDVSNYVILLMERYGLAEDTVKVDEDDMDGTALAEDEDDCIPSFDDMTPEAKERIVEEAMSAEVDMNVVYATFLDERDAFDDRNGIDREAGEVPPYQRAVEDLMRHVSLSCGDGTITLEELLGLRATRAVSAVLERLPEEQRASCFVAVFCNVAKDALYVVDEFSDLLEEVTMIAETDADIDRFTGEFVGLLLQRCRLA